ncbi:MULTISPECIES: hypothetical protein [Actinomycetes]|uniref:hypothetical protein n=1 Tax=Aeromicrobium tamlense TaxID=375541 RepID=UPI0031DBD91B
MSAGMITSTASVDLPEDDTILELTGGENPLRFLNMSEPDTALGLIAGMSDHNRIEGWRRAEQQYFDEPRSVILDALAEQERSLEQDTCADGGVDLDTLSTHDLVGEALEDLDDQDGGVPTGDVIDWVVERTELEDTDVLDAIESLHNRGHIYEPEKGQLRRTDPDDERWSR